MLVTLEGRLLLLLNLCVRARAEADEPSCDEAALVAADKSDAVERRGHDVVGEVTSDGRLGEAAADDESRLPKLTLEADETGRVESSWAMGESERSIS